MNPLTESIDAPTATIRPTTEVEPIVMPKSDEIIASILGGGSTVPDTGVTPTEDTQDNSQTIAAENKKGTWIVVGVVLVSLAVMFGVFRYLLKRSD